MRISNRMQPINKCKKQNYTKQNTFQKQKEEMTKKCNISNKFVLVKVIKKADIEILKTVGYICNIGIFGSQKQRKTQKSPVLCARREMFIINPLLSPHILLSAHQTSSSGVWKAFRWPAPLPLSLPMLFKNRRTISTSILIPQRTLLHFLVKQI